MSDLLFSNEILPSFSKLKTEEVHDAINSIIENNKKQLDSELKKSNKLEVLNSLEEMMIKLTNAWSPVSHLNSVMSSPDIRQAYESSLNDIVQFGLLIEQDKRIFDLYKDIQDKSTDKLKHDHVLEKLLTHKIRDFKLAGVELDTESKELYKQLATDLSKDTTQFSNNVMDCTDAWTYHTTIKEHIIGIPDDVLAIAKNRAKKEEHEGWLFGLDAPTYLGVMKYADNRDLRAAFHYAYATRASKKGPHDEKFDNTQLMFDILSKRRQKAKLLNFNNYAEYSLAPKMVDKPEVVLGFLNDLLAKAKPAALKEWEELCLFAAKEDNINELKPWDVAYYSEKQKQSLFNLSDEKLKEYFPLDKVLSGFFEILTRIYGVNLKINTNADVWHPDVTCYDVIDSHKIVIGHVYLDLFARLNKRGGAWMDECRVRCFTDNIKQLPVAYLTCNFTQPSEDKPALLPHSDVVTLFHEFGHCLHHLLTQIDYPSLSGINGVPWDAVELPSQFHENWCWHPDSLPLISSHYLTGEPLPEKYLKKLIKQKNYQSGLFLLRQLTFALFDFRLHMNFYEEQGTAQIQETINQVRKEVSVIPTAEYDQFQQSFSHIFAGGYAAGYYSYLWAEVLAANCFEKFRQNDIFSRDIGQEFLDKILSQGGSVDFNTVTEDFCGHEMQVEPLLKSYGI